MATRFGSLFGGRSARAAAASAAAAPGAQPAPHVQQGVEMQPAPAVQAVAEAGGQAGVPTPEVSQAMAPPQPAAAPAPAPVAVQPRPHDAPRKAPKATPVQLSHYGDFALSNSDIASSLMLQQLLYYHAFFAVAWVGATVVHMGYKGSDTAVEDVGAVAVFCLMEPLRLLAGFSGNLQEKVPSLLGFLLLTAGFGLPVSLYFVGLLGADARAFDKALNWVAVVMYALELVFGAAACVGVMRSQAQKFYLLDFATFQVGMAPPQHQQQNPLQPQQDVQAEAPARRTTPRGAVSPSLAATGSPLLQRGSGRDGDYAQPELTGSLSGGPPPTLPSRSGLRGSVGRLFGRSG